MNRAVLLSVIVGVALLSVGNGWASSSQRGVRHTPVVQKAPEEPKTPTSEADDKDVKAPSQAQMCDALTQYNKDKEADAKKSTPEPKPEPKSNNADRSPKVVTVAMKTADAEQSASSAEVTETEKPSPEQDAANKSVKGMNDEEREALAKQCADKGVDMGSVEKDTATGTQTPPDASAQTPPVADVAPQSYSAPYGGDVNASTPSTLGATPGMSEIFQASLQQYMQQEMMKQLSGQQGTTASDTGSTCPTGFTLATVSGTLACVGTGTGTTTNPTTANCVSLNNKTYCRENSCAGTERESITINSIKYCTGGTAESDGYADGVASHSGVCGRKIADNYTQNQDYLAAYVRGVNDCRSNGGVQSSTVTPVNENSDDAAVRVKCADQIVATANSLTASGKNIPSCLLDMAFRPQYSLVNSTTCAEEVEGLKEMDVFGRDRTRQNLMITAKTQFDAGKIDALNGKTLNAETSILPEAYRQGFACGKNL